ncbi:MAG TPA: helix-turn-helix domain-containing protein [Myxococcales bacterium]|nr:helix-turn-helix domain-containing protein [Myxococcales bacterium]
MPRPRYERAAPELKTAILSAARKEFARAGYEGASLNRILDAAGLSKGAFYYYFDDKADLAATVLLDLYRPATQAMDALAHPRSAVEFWSVARRVNREQLDAFESSRESLDVLTSLGRAMVSNRELGEKIMPAFAPMAAAFLEMLRRGQEMGVVRKDMTAQQLVGVIGAMKEGLARVAFPPQGALSPEELEKFANLTWDLVVRVVRVEEP